MKKAIFAIGSLLLCLSTNANDFIFKTRTSTGNWASTGNWTVNNVNATTLPEADDKINITTTNHPVMINDLQKTIRWQLIYKQDAPSTTINGTVENTFKGDNQSIDNQSSNVQTINFPIKIGEAEGRNTIVGIKSGVGMVFNSTIKLNGNKLYFEGGSTTHINNTIIGKSGRVEVKNAGVFILGSNARIVNADLFVQGSTLKFEGTSNLDMGTNLLLENSALIDLNAAGVDVESITENQNMSTLDVNGGVLSICGSQNSQLESTLLKGTGTIINKGGGVLTLANTSDDKGKFTGAIEVQSGKVVVKNDNVDLKKIVVSNGAFFQSSVNVSADTLKILPGAQLIVDREKTITVKGILEVGEGAVVTGGGKIDAKLASIVATSLPLPSYLTVATNPNITVNPGTILKINGTRHIGTLKMLNDEHAGQSALQYINNASLTADSVQVIQKLYDVRNYYISNPFGGALPAGRNYYQYIENGAGTTAASHWISCTRTNRGAGFIVQNTGVADLIFSGSSLNNGDVQVHVTRGGVVKSGFNLVGNPYLSYFNAAELLKNNAAMEPSIWYRTKSGRSYSFQTVNSVSGVSTGHASAIVPPLQAFWVRTVSNAGTDLRMKPSMETTSTNRLRTAPVQKGTLLRLTVSGSYNSDETVLYENENAAYGVDDYDSHKMSNDNVNIPELYTVEGGDQLVINGVPAMKLNTNISLGFRTLKENDVYKLKVSELENLDENIRVILKDGTNETDITDGAEYSFQSDKYDGTDRFSIILRSPEVATGVKKVTNNEIVAFAEANGDIVVKTNAEEDGVVTVYNAAGQRVASQQLVDGKASVHLIHTAGVYWVKVNGDNGVVARKVIVK